MSKSHICRNNRFLLTNKIAVSFPAGSIIAMYTCIMIIYTMLQQKFATGDLLVSLRCNVSHQKLQGIILKAVNLPRPHKWGMAGEHRFVFRWWSLSNNSEIGGNDMV